MSLTHTCAWPVSMMGLPCMQVYMAGHGGDGFLKFLDTQELLDQVREAAM